MTVTMKWSVIKKKIIYHGFFKLSEIKLQHELFVGGQSPVLRRELLDRGQAVAVLPYDPVRDEVVLVEQFRIGAGNDKSGPWLIEIIAGYQEAAAACAASWRTFPLVKSSCQTPSRLPVFCPPPLLVTSEAGVRR